MQKIPTLFKRNPEDMRHVLPEVTPGCEWVLAGEGAATRKYDGTCVMFDGEGWWARREVKPGKQAPENFRPVETDETTGKTVGWEPIEQSPFAKFHAECVERGVRDSEFVPGTYELCGPKVNGNPEGFEHHVLLRHAAAAPLDLPALDPDPALARAQLCEWLVRPGFDFEGIVWHHPDGRMTKLKVRDFSGRR